MGRRVHGESHTDRHIVNMFRYAALASALLLASVNGARVRRDDAYGAPEPDTYGAPAETYGVTAPEYGAAETGLDLTTIIIPLLALLGLFLLFPTYVTLTTVRRKREAVDESSEVSAVARMMDMYQAIMESEECLERVACGVGAMASDAGLDTSLASVASVMVPSKYSKLMKQFGAAKNCKKIKCGSLF